MEKVLKNKMVYTYIFFIWLKVVKRKKGNPSVFWHKWVKWVFSVVCGLIYGDIYVYMYILGRG